MVLCAFLEPGLVIQRLQGRQAKGGLGGVAVAVVLAVGPGGFELPAGVGTLLINRAAHALTDLAFKGDAARRFAVGAEHGHPSGTDALHQIVGDRATG